MVGASLLGATSKDGRGDIMQEEGSFPIPQDLQSRLRDTPWMQGDPFLRVVLASNGYVNAVMAAWYNSNVDVIVLRDVLSDVTPIEADFGWLQDQKFERQIQLQTDMGIFCLCSCRAILRDRPDVVEAVLSKRIGVDRIFHHFNILPRFRLVDAGAVTTEDGRTCLWREYAIFGPGIECRVREDFRPDFLLLHDDEDPKSPRVGPSSSPKKSRTAQPSLLSCKRLKSSPHPTVVNFGNFVLGDELPKALSQASVAKHPLQRALLIAGANITRILSAYHLSEVSFNVLSSVLKAGHANVFERVSFVCAKGVVLGRVRACVTVQDEEIIDEIKNGLSTAPSSLFRHTNYLPKLTLLNVVVQSSCPMPGFGRHYLLTGRSISCEVKEEFSQLVLHLFDGKGFDGKGLDAPAGGVPELF